MNTMRSIRKSTKFSSLLPNMNLIRIFEILKKNPGKSKNTYNLVQDEQITPIQYKKHIFILAKLRYIEIFFSSHTPQGINLVLLSYKSYINNIIVICY